MKLLRYGPKGQEKPGLLDAQGKIRDLSKVVDDIDGSALSDASLAKLSQYRDQLPCALVRRLTIGHALSFECCRHGSPLLHISGEST